MPKILLVTEASSDITPAQAEAAGIVMRGAGVHIDGIEYEEGHEMPADRFFEEFNKAKELPHTSAVTPHTFQDEYQKAYDNGVTDIIHVTIHSGGSATLNSAKLAAKSFYEENPEAVGVFNIRHVDSNAYSVMYGYAVLEAARMANEGSSVQDILDFLEDWLDRVEVYFVVFTLDTIRRSGRVGAAAAIAGDLLGLKPIICMTEGQSRIVEKMRGEKRALACINEIVKRNIEKDGEYLIMSGENAECSSKLAAMLTETLGYSPVNIGLVGPSIVINTGPQMVGVTFKGKRRGHRHNTY